ncbi:hypothetical protein KSS87_001980 [Heliosperma pusillum]|nr:hypothetical protein KSS87_001980 [Heliosperma pusillum]
MGREWNFIWGSKSSNKKTGGVKSDGGGGGGGGGRGSREKKMVRTKVAAAAVASGGCMNALLHMFDFHHFHICLHPQNSSYLSDEDDPTPCKGVEAPRNSLSNIEDEKQFYFKSPMGIQIKTNRRDTRLKVESKTKDILEEAIDSPALGARTPTIVARLMGLDVLPESNTSTPRSSSSYSRVSTRSPPSRTTRTQRKRSVKNDLPSGLGRSSLPDSPKSSTSSQRRMSLSMNAVDKHRLSLQINKENNIVKEMESSRRSCSAINTKKREGRRYEEEYNNKSRGYYAKQVKETVSNRREFGVDITNKIRQKEFRKDENLLIEKQPIKQNKSRLLVKSSEITKKTRISRCDVREIVPTIDKLEVKNDNKQIYCCEKMDVADLKKFDNADNNGMKSSSKMSTKSCEYIRNKKDDELFVRPLTKGNNLATEKKCKKTPLTKELVHSTVPSIVPLKKDSSYVEATPKKLLEKQGSSKAQITKHYNTSTTTKQLSRKPGRQTNATVQQEAAHNPVDHEKTTPTSTSIAEFQYISRILKCTGINNDTSISLTKWFSPLHPLDPTIYHNLEASYNFTTVNIDHLPSLINRKLIFHLVNAILADILLKPNNNLQINGLQLVKTLCTRIRSFTSIDCKTLQDIDTLVEQDMPRFGEDGEAIVAEIERDIFDSLVQEIVVF